MVFDKKEKNKTSASLTMLVFLTDDEIRCVAKCLSQSQRLQIALELSSKERHGTSRFTSQETKLQRNVTLCLGHTERKTQGWVLAFY